MREFLIKILKGVIENWLISLIAASGVVIGGWLLWLYRVYLKDWLLSTRYVEMPGWAWVLIALGISTVPALLVFWIMRRKTQRRKRVLTNETDIKNALRHWFQYNMLPRLGWKSFQETVNFSNLDQPLALPKGSAKRHIEGIVKEFDGWKTKEKGEDTIVIFHDDPHQSVFDKMNRRRNYGGYPL